MTCPSVSLRGIAQKQAAFAAGLNERDEFVVLEFNLCELDIPADGGSGTVGNMKSARWGLFDDEFGKEFRIDTVLPHGEQFALVVEVENFEVA